MVGALKMNRTHDKCIIMTDLLQQITTKYVGTKACKQVGDGKSCCQNAAYKGASYIPLPGKER